MEERVEELEARLRHNSTNSDKPPSNDRPKVRKKKGKTGEAEGGAPGHPAHFRELAPPERVDHTVPHFPPCCGDCGGTLAPALAVGEPLRKPRWETPPLRADITEHQLFKCLCPNCGAHARAHLPEAVPDVAFGPRFTAIVALMVGRFRLSRRETSQLVGTLTDTTIAPPTVTKPCERASEALEAP